MVELAMGVERVCWRSLGSEGWREGPVRLRLQIRGARRPPGRRAGGDRRAICVTYVI